MSFLSDFGAFRKSVPLSPAELSEQYVNDFLNTLSVERERYISQLPAHALTTEQLRILRGYARQFGVTDVRDSATPNLPPPVIIDEDEENIRSGPPRRRPHPDG
ncbi:MAG: hypothetical protein Q9222_000812 [Ikaeria aurantiellina]